MKSDINEFISEVTAREDDIDHNNHVNNVSYLKWTQQVSIAHWEARVPPESDLKIKWVVIRHEVEYIAPAFLKENIIVKNEWGGASRLRFEQFTDFVRLSDCRLLAKVYSLLCPVQIRTDKPFVIDERMRALLGITHGLQKSHRHRRQGYSSPLMQSGARLRFSP